MFKKLFCAYASRREDAPTDLQNDPTFLNRDMNVLKLAIGTG